MKPIMTVEAPQALYIEDDGEPRLLHLHTVYETGARSFPWCWRTAPVNHEEGELIKKQKLAGPVTCLMCIVAHLEFG